MLTEAQWQSAVALLPFLSERKAAITQAFISHASVARFPTGATVFEEGDVCSAFTVLVSGHVRVFKIGETGREITLYRFARGESCILTASCILNEQQFPAIATVEEPCEALVVPNTVFQTWVDEHRAWRAYVFQLLSRRLATVMVVLEEVAFRRMDARIAELLIARLASDTHVVGLTHQQIASELGTSREVVSRILADWAADRLVLLGRGTIAIADRGMLARRVGLR